MARSLACNVNLNSYCLSYPADRWADLFLTTELHAKIEDLPPEEKYRKALKVYSDRNPKSLIGTYLSGSDCRKREHVNTYPSNAIYYEDIPEQFYMTPYNEQTRRVSVNIVNDEARGLFADKICEEAFARGRNLLFLDNIAHPMQASGWHPWEVTCDFLMSIKKRIGLYYNPMKLFINVACLPGDMTRTDADAMAQVAHGWTLEQPLHSSIRSTMDKVKAEIKTYRRWLFQGRTVVLLNTQAPGLSDEFFAAFVMIVSGRDEDMYMTPVFWQPLPEWANWRTKFGKPVSAEVYDGFVCQRKFEHGILQINFQTGEWKAEY